MRRLTMVVVLCVLGVLQMTAGIAEADTYTFQPTPADLWDLDHYKYYTWGIQWDIPNGESIAGASLFIDNINDWTVESGDVLYVHLLDDPLVGAKEWPDNQGGNALSGQGVLLTTYTDDDGYPNPTEDWQYDFSMSEVGSLNHYAADGLFGFGFDPDCHYNNDGVTLTVHTTPEPQAAVLIMMGIGLVFMKRRTAPVPCAATT